MARASRDVHPIAWLASDSERHIRAIPWTAVTEDGILGRNPCRVPGADKENPQERPTLTVRQVFALADAVPARYRAMILLATFASLRYGELIALQRVDIDLEAGTVRVRQAYNELRGVGMVLGPPKSRAGVRTVSLPKPSTSSRSGRLPWGRSARPVWTSMICGTPATRSQRRRG